MENRQIRIHYFIAFIFLFALEAFIAVYVHDEVIRPYVGDVLVVILVYCFLRILFPAGTAMLPLWVFLFAAAVEFLQYFRLLEVLGIQNRIVRIVLGSVFDWKDIGCYAAGCMLLVVWEMVEKKQKGSRDT